VILACALSIAAHASAQTPESLSGRWDAGPVVSDVAIERWNDACDAPPKARSAGGGTSVEIEQQGQRLSIRGAGVDIRSGDCGKLNPQLRPLATSANDGLWVTRCATQAGNTREEQGTYTLRALGPDRLIYQDVTHLNWKAGSLTCRATVTSKQSLVRSAAAAAKSQSQVNTASSPRVLAASEAAPTTPRAPSGAGCTPGPVARISLRPRESELQLGERLCLQAKVEDAAGCPVQNATLRWSLEHGPAIRGTLAQNCFQAGDRSAESEGHFEVLAEVGALRGRATVRVVAHNLRELTARRVDGVGVSPATEPAAAPASSPIETASEPTTRFAARALGQTERVRQRVLMGIAAALAVVAAVLALSRRSKRRVPTSPDAPQPTRRCPSCGASYPDTIAYCGADGTALAPVRRS
jgi:hypothetical protein